MIASVQFDVFNKKLVAHCPNNIAKWECQARGRKRRFLGNPIETLLSWDKRDRERHRSNRYFEGVPLCAFSHKIPYMRIRRAWKGDGATNEVHHFQNYSAPEEKNDQGTIVSEVSNVIRDSLRFRQTPMVN